MMRRPTASGCEFLAATGIELELLEQDSCKKQLEDLFHSQPEKEILISPIVPSANEGATPCGTPFEFRSFVRALIMVNDRCWAALYLLSYRKDAFTGQDIEVLGILRENFGPVVATPIPINTRLAEAPNARKTIWEYAPRSTGAKAYIQLVERILGE